jgi:hypothetical protein
VAWTVDVVASAGVARFDFVFPRVMAKEGDLADLCPVAVLLTVAIASVAALLADDMLSRATSVTGAAFRGQVLQPERRESSFDVSFGFSTLPSVPGVAGSGVSSGLRGVAASVVGFVLTRFGDPSGAIEDYQGFLQSIHISSYACKINGVALREGKNNGWFDNRRHGDEALRGCRSATSST